MEVILLGVLTAVITAVLSGFTRSAARKTLDHHDRRRVHRWLRGNTRDEPANSHASTNEIAKGTGLSEDRVRRACLNDGRIFQSRHDEDLWSVWREEPQSVYEKRGLFIV